MKTLRFLAFSCVHAPLGDSAAIDWMLGQISDRKPDVVVHLGDGVESNASSRWDDAKEAVWSLKDEFIEHDKFLARVRKAAPDSAKLVFTPGNHEDNILKAGRIDPRLRDICDWRKNQPELQHWHTTTQYNYCRTRGCYRLGQVVFSHGYDTSPGTVKREAFYFCDPFGLYVHGHTHRPTPVQQVEWSQLPLRCWYANTGCLRELDPQYMQRNRKWNWGQAIVVGEAAPIKSPRMARYWDAETVTHRMYDDWAQKVVA